MFHIKICGVRRPQDVQAAASCGADAIGLNFFERSVRYVEPVEQSTRELSRLAGGKKLLRVGVFVNSAAESIARIAETVELDVIQLHGDEEVAGAEAVRSAANLPIVRAIKLSTHPLSVEEIDAKTRVWIDAGCHPLLDADAGAAHGGSGKTLHWPSIEAWSSRSQQVAWTLAGGLNPENVAQAIQSSGARSVDAASGVEEPKGVKSPELIKRFASEARKALGKK